MSNVQIPMSNEGFWSIKNSAFGLMNRYLMTKTESWEPEAEKKYKHVMDMAGHIEKILPQIRPQYAINDRAQRIHHLTLLDIGHSFFPEGGPPEIKISTCDGPEE